MIITQSNFKGIFLRNFVFELVINKSMDEPPSPLKHVFFHHIVKRMLLRKCFITLFSAFMLKSPRMIISSYQVE